MTRQNESLSSILDNDMIKTLPDEVKELIIKSFGIGVIYAENKRQTEAPSVKPETESDEISLKHLLNVRTIDARTYNVLAKAGIKNLSELADFPVNKLAHVKGCGKNTIEKITSLAASYGITMPSPQKRRR